MARAAGCVMDGCWACSNSVRQTCSTRGPTGGAPGPLAAAQCCCTAAWTSSSMPARHAWGNDWLQPQEWTQSKGAGAVAACNAQGMANSTARNDVAPWSRQCNSNVKAMQQHGQGNATAWSTQSTHLRCMLDAGSKQLGKAGHWRLRNVLCGMQPGTAPGLHRSLQAAEGYVGSGARGQRYGLQQAIAMHEQVACGSDSVHTKKAHSVDLVKYAVGLKTSRRRKTTAKKNEAFVYQVGMALCTTLPWLCVHPTAETMCRQLRMQTTAHTLPAQQRRPHSKADSCPCHRLPAAPQNGIINTRCLF